MSKASNEPVLLRRDEGRVAVLTLNRPHAMNALSGELIDALQAEFDRLAKDRTGRFGFPKGSRLLNNLTLVTRASQNVQSLWPS